MRFVIFGLVFYLVYFFIRTLFVKPFREGYAQSQQGRGGQRWKNPFQKEGEVTIIANPKNRKIKDEGVGDYVDYEEVKE